MKTIEFCGRSLEVIRSFSVTAKREAGYQLDRIQRGFDPQDWKPMATVGKGVREIRIQEQGQYRIIYVASIDEVIFVLHAFHKKTRKARNIDIAKAKRELKTIHERLAK